MAAVATLLAAGVAAPTATLAQAPVELEWWHNFNLDPGLTLWQNAADEYHAAHPNVTIKVVPMQNEQFTTKIPVALQSDNPPDIFQDWGGGQLIDQVNAGKVQDLTAAVAPWIDSIGGAAGGWQVGGKQYGIPYNLGIVGFWYNKDLFKQAGVEVPATWDELIDATAKLKAAGIAPIALGQKDRWPAAFYWDYMALRTCGEDIVQATAQSLDFSDPCWVEAGNQVKRLVDAQPFQEAYEGTPAQNVPTSSAGLLANGKAAMELQGHWNPNAMTTLTDPAGGLGDKLGWFPFPAVTGGKGDPADALGGGDGYSVSTNAPPEAADFLKYLVSLDVQKKFGAKNAGLPVAKDPSPRSRIRICRVSWSSRPSRHISRPTWISRFPPPWGRRSTALPPT